jgi:hypothetical protein
MDLLGYTFFQLGGPFEELGNVLIVFVVLQLARMSIGSFAVWLYDAAAQGTERKKIATNAFYAVYYTGAVALGLYLFRVTDWADRGTICSYEEASISLSRYALLHVYHCIQVAFYLNYLFAMLSGIDPVRKDQWAFELHHVITIFLILFSRNWGYMRAQLAIFVIHDAADPFLHFAKLVKATHHRFAPALSDAILVVFALVFFVTRWFVYPVYLVDSCRRTWFTTYPDDWTYFSTAQRPGLLAYFMAPDSIVLLGYKLSYLGLAVILSYALFGLHIFWGAHILRVAWEKFLPQPLPLKDGSPATATQKAEDSIASSVKSRRKLPNT